MYKNNVFWLCISAALLLSISAYWIYQKERIEPLSKYYQKPVSQQKIPKGLSSLSSTECGSCHKEHYNEWKVSTHAQAWTDAQFQSEMKKESSPYLCINCHIPLQNQQEFIVTGLKSGDIYKPQKIKNEGFDKALQQEGINCSSCHVRDGAILGAINSGLAPHPVKKAPELLNENACMSCHNANEVVTPELVCTFETGDEWKKGPFYGKKNCISCHMETTERSIVEGYPIRKSHKHYFAGSGIPKHKNLPSIGQNGLSIMAPDHLKIHEKAVSYDLILHNNKAGHRVPSGDPERFILVHFTLKNTAGKVLKETTHRIGEIWEWYPKAKKLSDNNINPGEKRLLSFTYNNEKNEKLMLETKITKHRMDKKTAEYNKLGANYPLFIDVFEKKILGPI